MRPADPHGVLPDDADDLEIGCLAFSRTHVKAGGFPRGGTIVGVNYDSDDTVLSVFTMEQVGAPYRLDLFEIDRADIDIDNMPERYFYGVNAVAAADIIDKWLGARNKPTSQQSRLAWQRRAMDLREIGTRGFDTAQQWLPEADRRARWFAEQRRRDHAAEASA